MFNREAIRKLPIGGKITEAGITAERTIKGVHISANAMIDGHRIHRRGFATLAEATAFIDQAKTDARHGRLNLPQGRKVALTFARAARDYIARAGTGERQKPSSQAAPAQDVPGAQLWR
jgi:hypothetical protein